MSTRFDRLVEVLESRWDGLAYEALLDPSKNYELTLLEAELRNVCPTSLCLPENLNPALIA